MKAAASVEAPAVSTEPGALVASATPSEHHAVEGADHGSSWHVAGRKGRCLGGAPAAATEPKVLLASMESLSNASTPRGADGDERVVLLPAADVRAAAERVLPSSVSA
ncbi:hypothetical protein GCM10012319_07330 [Comamonas sp. KCTC 72670]|nr:hypothetical protein GCM10012319_07330 [Comamonas sp. KCTC 72670]